MNAGISACGLTRVWNSPSTSPPRTLTAPISVIIDPPAAEPPVVSRSTTQNVMSRSGRPSSSKRALRLPAGRARAWRPARSGGVVVTGTTLGVGTDSARDGRAAYPATS